MTLTALAKAEEFMSVSAVQKIFGFAKPDGVHQLIRQGQLPATDVSAGGGKRPVWRVDPSDLRAFLATRRAVIAPTNKRRRAKRNKAETIQFFD